LKPTPEQIMPLPRLALTLVALAFLFAVVAPGSNVRAADTGHATAVSRTLDNGLEVVVIPDRRAPVVTHMVWYKVGSADEERGKSGIAHFLEHLMFKATKTAGEREFSARIAEIGGQENAFTTTDYTAYFQKVSPDALEMVMRYEADRMENLVLTDANVLPERDVILEERRQRVDANPGAILGEAMNASLYANHPYGIPIIGWEHEMAQLDREDALAFYDRFYTPNNAILVIAGDVEPDAAFKLAEDVYGKVKRRAEPGVRERPREPEPVAERRISYSDPRVATPSMTRTYVVPAYFTAAPREAEALDILATLLGGASTSRIRRAMLVDEQIASGAGAYYTGGYRDYGEFTVYAEPLPGKSIEEAEARLDAIIEKLLKDGVTEEEVAAARDMLVRTTIFERDSQGTMARIYGSVLAAGGTVADIEEWPDRVRSVTAADVNAAARKWLDRRRSVTGLLLPKEGS
jgi:zinc protease